MKVIDEIAAERERQIEVEGWDAKHDDAHSPGELAIAAGWYAFQGACSQYSDIGELSDPTTKAGSLFMGALYRDADGFYRWPWDAKWWKPKGARRDLVRAAALIVAEIERLDRAAVSRSTDHG